MLKLAIVGRPNVGKSALFNYICKKKIAIVDEQEGTTRDRLIGEAKIENFPFLVIDTGGIDPNSKDPLVKQIIGSTYKGVEEADAIVMVVDGKMEPNALDFEIAQFLLKTKKPVTLAVNKIDITHDEILVHNFYNLGIKNIIPISALYGYYIETLIETAWQGFTFSNEEKKEGASCKIAILGRPNVGKSTLINALLGEKRVIESPIAGTTIDAIDIPCCIDGKDYLFIDTAGVRRKKKEKELVEKFATLRREKAQSRADICLLVCNAVEGMTQEEKKIAKEIAEAGKGCILLLNKWDLVKGFRMEHCEKALREELPFIADLPIHFISAKEERNLDKVLDSIEKVKEALDQQIPTAALNKFIKNALLRNSPPVIENKRLKIYYLTQIGTSPPQFLLFVNHPTYLSLTYKKYLMNQMRQEFSLTGVPINFILRGKIQKED